MTQREIYIPSGGTFVTESRGLLWWEVDHNESVSPGLACILYGLLFSVCEHGIVVSYGTRLSAHFRIGQARRPTHEEHGSLESLVSGLFDLAQHLSVGNILFDSDLRAESVRAPKFDRTKYRV